MSHHTVDPEAPGTKPHPATEAAIDAFTTPELEDLRRAYFWLVQRAAARPLGGSVRAFSRDSRGEPPAPDAARAMWRERRREFERELARIARWANRLAEDPPARLKCASCGKWVSEKYRFCGNCGADMGGVTFGDGAHDA